MIELSYKIGDSMLNKKGFTIAEVLVSFSLISIILASLISATMFYRDKVKDEEVKSQLWDFKNTITKTIYDDIINNGIVRAESCIGSTNTCVNLIDKDDNYYQIKIEEYNEENRKGVYLSYNGIKYLLPDSDLGIGVGRTDSDRICDFIGGFDVSTYNNKIYKVKASFRHKDMNLHYDLLFIIS